MITKDMLPKAVEVATGPHPNASDAAGAKPVSILYINNRVYHDNMKHIISAVIAADTYNQSIFSMKKD
jgi:hypothetical protein